MEQSSSQPRHYWMGGKRDSEQDRFFQQTLNAAGWQCGDMENWNACWYTGMPDPSVFRQADRDHRINHIPGNNCLTVKSRLHDTIVATRDRIQEQYGPKHEFVSRLGFLPNVFSMPHDYHALQQAALEDPDRRWILKPKNAARGKGIRVVSDVAQIPLDDSWMVQQYLERTHTMHERKYVLRLYVLIASIDPLRVYLYQKGFAKLASAPYDINDPDNIYSHLTNPDVNALNEDAEVPVEFVEFEQYRRWLRESGHDDARLFSRIEDLVTLTCLSAAEPMRQRCRKTGTDTRGCYELLGIDCLVDTDLKPWILECNLSPSMGVCAAPESGGDTEEAVKGQLIADMVSLVDLDAADTPQSSDPGECIAQEARLERERAGAFKRLFPNPEPEHYLPFLPMPRLSDIILADAVRGERVTRPVVQRRYATELITDDQVSVYEEHTGRLDRLNNTASFIWLMAMEGETPDAIWRELTAASRATESAPQPDPWTIRNDVWNSLADWAQAGLIMQRPMDCSAGTPAKVQSRPRSVSELKLSTTAFRRRLLCGSGCFEFYTDSQPVAARISGMLEPLVDPSPGDDAPRLEVVRDTPGYTVILDGEVIATRLPLAALGPSLAVELAQRSVGADETVMDAGLVVGSHATGADGLMFTHAEPGLADPLALAYRSHTGGAFARGLRLDANDPGMVRAMGLPGRAGEAPCREAGVADPLTGHVRHRLHDASDAFLVPSDGDTLNRAQTVTAIIIPEYTNSPGEAGWRRAAAGEALSHLLPHCYAANRQPLDAATLVRLADWLGACYCLVVEAGRPELIADAIGAEKRDRFGDAALNVPGSS